MRSKFILISGFSVLGLVVLIGIHRVESRNSKWDICEDGSCTSLDGFTDWNGPGTKHPVAPSVGEFQIVDLRQTDLGNKIRSWDLETANLDVSPRTSCPPGAFVCEKGTGFWKLGEQPINAITVFRFLVGSAHPEWGGFVLEFTKLTGPGPEKPMILEDWAEKGPIPNQLYRPLQHLLSDCALVTDPDHPNIKPRLDVPVIVGQDSHGKDIIVMKPLITKFVKSDGDPIQVFTGNRKEDKYFDRKYNPSQSTKP